MAHCVINVSVVLNSDHPFVVSDVWTTVAP